MLGVLALCLLPAISQDGSQGGEELRAFEARLDALRVRLQIPGLALGLVRDGELQWFRGLGFADLENEVAITADTPFHLASLTKTFASAVLMRLVEEEAIELDAPLADYGVNLQGAGVITVRHVFSHTSEGPPGQYYSYSGNRFGSLDGVLEAVTTVPFAQVLDELVLRPLELEQTGPQLGSYQPALATGYLLNEEGQVVRGTYPTFLGVSAGLVSSVNDLARFYTAVLDHELLAPETQALAFAPTRSTLGHELPYGLGWFSEEYLGKRVLWHYGWWDCISSLVVVVPEDELVFLALANTDHLSRSFDLGVGHGSLVGSPFALAFFRELVWAGEEAWPEVDWTAAPADVRGRIESVRDLKLRRLLMDELWSNASTYRTVGQQHEVGRLLAVYGDVTRLDALAELEGQEVLAQIDGVGPNADESTELSCAKGRTVHVVAVGEERGAALLDHGWIENDAGDVVWEMTTERAEHAGGSLGNRVCTGSLDLAPGTYRLRYRTDGGHDAARWAGRPPDGLFWGIAVFAE